MLDSVIRMSQARAKLALRHIVTAEDAQDVVELMQESLFEACFQDMGFNAQVDQIANGKKKQKASVNPNDISSLSIPKQTKIYIAKLKDMAQARNTRTFEYTEMLGYAKDLNLQVGDFRQFVDKLNAQNHLLMKSSKVYELCG